MTTQTSFSINSKAIAEVLQSRWDQVNKIYPHARVFQVTRHDPVRKSLVSTEPVPVQPNLGISQRKTDTLFAFNKGRQAFKL